MTILVAYAPRPEGRAALEKGIEIAKRRNMRLLVVNASPGAAVKTSRLPMWVRRNASRSNWPSPVSTANSSNLCAAMTR